MVMTTSTIFSGSMVYIHRTSPTRCLPRSSKWLSDGEARRRAASFHRSGVPSPAPGETGPVLQFCCSWAENRRYGAVLGGPPRIRNEVSEGVCGHLRTARQGFDSLQAHHLAEFKPYSLDLQQDPQCCSCAAVWGFRSGCSGTHCLWMPSAAAQFGRGPTLRLLG